MLRIIAGTWKGRRIAAPPGLATRPVTDRIKQSLCDWLGDVTDVRVIDVCAGSGSFAFEMASRGAKEVHAIELATEAYHVLTDNHAHLGNPAHVRLYHDDLFRVVPTLSSADLVFCDPPFPWFAERPDDLVRLLMLVRDALAPEGLIVLRGESGQRAPVVDGLRHGERRDYGRSWVLLLHRA